MKKSKKTFAMVLAMLMAFAFVACQNNDDVESYDEPTVSEDTSQADNVDYDSFLSESSSQSEEVCITIDNKYTLYGFSENDTSFTIPSDVTEIGENAFKGCTSFQSITIGSDVTTIVAGAFSGCSLTSATFKNKSGWKVDAGMEISSTDLNNTSTAARYLKTSYGGYTWTRSK